MHVPKRYYLIKGSYEVFTIIRNTLRNLRHDSYPMSCEDFGEDVVRLHDNPTVSMRKSKYRFDGYSVGLGFIMYEVSLG